MANTTGNPAALAAYRNSHPDWKKRISKAAKRRRDIFARQQASVAASTGVAPGRSVAITVVMRDDGRYVPGSSRSFTIEGCPATPEQVRAALRDFFPLLRKRIESKDRPLRETVKW